MQNNSFWGNVSCSFTFVSMHETPAAPLEQPKYLLGVENYWLEEIILEIKSIHIITV